MIWHKAWLESRLRFLLMAIMVTFVVGWAILNCDQAMARFDRRPPITFTQYVWFVYAGRVQMMWAASVLLLGLGGLLRERELGTAQYTLSLPVSRARWLAVRTATGVMQSAALAAIPAVVIPVAARIVGRSYPLWEAFKYSSLLFAIGIVFLGVGLLWSSILSGQIAAAAIGLASLYFIFTAYDYLYRWFPYFSMSGLISGADHVNRATGFLNGWPLSSTLISLGVTAALSLIAARFTERVEF